MPEKRRLRVLASPDAPPADPAPRTLMPEILPTPGPRQPDGGVRQRTLRHLDRLRGAAIPEDAQRDGDPDPEPAAGEPR
jgi:hypothetical protein